MIKYKYHSCSKCEK